MDRFQHIAEFSAYFRFVKLKTLFHLANLNLKGIKAMVTEKIELFQWLKAFYYLLIDCVIMMGNASRIVDKLSWFDFLC